MLIEFGEMNGQGMLCQMTLYSIILYHLILCMLGDFSCFLSSADFFLNELFFKKSFRSTMRVSNSFDLDQDRRPVGPDRGPKCLQMLSADDKSHR